MCPSVTKAEAAARPPLPSRLTSGLVQVDVTTAMDNSERSASVSADRAGMAAALRAARAGIATGQSPFGCAIGRNGRVLIASHNTVWRDTDPTRHAEVNAISAACRKLGSIYLSGCTLYATCEPCPMCFSAAHWARVSRAVFGASIADARAAGFNELVIPARDLKRLGRHRIELVSGFMAEECRALFAEWQKAGKCGAY